MRPCPQARVTSRMATSSAARHPLEQRDINSLISRTVRRLTDGFPVNMQLGVDLSTVGIILEPIAWESRSMPEFALVSRQEAMASSTTGRNSQILQEYTRYIEGLSPETAVRLTPSVGETVATVRRRLGSAIKASSKSIQIKRVGSEIFFWEDPPERRGGRPPKNLAS